MDDPYENPYEAGDSYGDSSYGPAPRRSGAEVWIGLAIGLVILAGVGYALYGERLLTRDAPQPAPPPVAEPSAPAPQAQAPPVEPEIQYPVPVPEAAEPQAPLPSLGDSDAAMRQTLEKTFGKAPVESFLVPRRIIELTVATIDSLDRDPIPLKMRPLSYVPGLLVVDRAQDRIYLGAGNARRYAPLVSALQAADARAIAAVYLRHYPMFQEAYHALGYPGRHFNDRLVAVIDHLLAAPEIKAPIELIRPKVLYQFAHPELEQLSSGRKILLRLGPENAAVVKAKLKEIRDAITASSR